MIFERETGWWRQEKEKPEWKQKGENGETSPEVEVTAKVSGGEEME